MFAQYVKPPPQNKPQFTYMGNEADALAKIHAGFKPDLFRPYVGWVKYFATSGLVQPWDTKLISNFKNLNPFRVKAGQYQGKQYGIPDDWGFDAILYRSDKVKPKAKSWSLLFDERYKGKIAWLDDIEMLEIAGLYLGFKNTWNQTDDQLKQSQKLLISKKHLVRKNWSSETDLWQLFGSGEAWIAYAWPNDWVQMKKKFGQKGVYMRPKGKPTRFPNGCRRKGGHSSQPAKAAPARPDDPGPARSAARVACGVLRRPDRDRRGLQRGCAVSLPRSASAHAPGLARLPAQRRL